MPNNIEKKIDNGIIDAKNKKVTVGNDNDDINLAEINKTDDIDKEEHSSSNSHSVESMYNNKLNGNSTIIDGKTEQSISVNKHRNEKTLEEIEGLDPIAIATGNVEVVTSKTSATKIVIHDET